MSLTQITPKRPINNTPGEDTSFNSPGTAHKPAGCQDCQFRLGGAGFVVDYVPPSPKIGLLLPFPSGDDVLENRPWAGKAGYAWTRSFLQPVGLRREDVLIAHCLRCAPLEYGKYPTAAVKRSAELTCRQYDNQRWSQEGLKKGGLSAWDPNLFLITFHPADSRPVPALSQLILVDMRKAVRFAEKGYRPLVLMGTPAMEMVAPWLAKKGGAHDWRGHFWESQWPWKEEPVIFQEGQGKGNENWQQEWKGQNQ